MKKILVMIFMQVALSFVMAYSQDSNTQADASKAKARAEALISKAEHNVKNLYKLNDAVNKLMFDPDLSCFDDTGTRNFIGRFVKIYYIIEKDPDQAANRERILEMVGAYKETTESHELFLHVLNSTNQHDREKAVWSLSPYVMHPDDIYEKVKALGNEGKISKHQALQGLAKANPKRAYEEMKDILRTTQDIREFVFVGANLPLGYTDIPAMDIILDRYNEFLKKPSVDGYSPDRAIYFTYLWEYINARDGTRLKTALEMLKTQGVCGLKDLPKLKNKLKSYDPITRGAVIDFLTGQAGYGSIRRQDVLSILNDAKNSESNYELRQKIEKSIDTLNSREQR